MNAEQTLIYKRISKLLTKDQYLIGTLPLGDFVVGSSSPNEHVMIAFRNSKLGHTIQITLDRLDLGVRGTFEFVCNDPLILDLVTGFKESKMITKDAVMFMMDSAHHITKCGIYTRYGMYKWLGEGESASELSNSVGQPFGGKIGWQ